VDPLRTGTSARTFPADPVPVRLQQMRPRRRSHAACHAKRRSDLSGHAGYGYFASHSRFFRGFRLYLISTPKGLPVIWRLANPKLGEREVTQALLTNDHRLIRSGWVILGDKGFAGRDFERFITEDLGATLVRPDRNDVKPRFGRFGGIRQWIESVFDTLKGQLGLEHHGGRTLEGVYARVASRTPRPRRAGIWHNWHTNTCRKRSLTAYDH
jgi:hypothetical protein